MNKNLNLLIGLLIFGLQQPLHSDLLVEFKTSAFVPTHKKFREIYGSVAPQFGAEATFNICPHSCWYGFASAEFLTKKGCSIGLCDYTKINLTKLALGVKYFVPHCYGDFYVGVGLLPAHLKTINCSQFVNQRISKWGIGAIAKIGSYFDLPCNCFVNLFAEYSFLRIGCDCCSIAKSVKAKLDGANFGIGLGYRFY